MQSRIVAHPVSMAIPQVGRTVQLEEVIEQMRAECILDAKSEDHVQDCMRAFDHALEAAEEDDDEDEAISPLEECILHAASEDEVQTCLQKMDDDELDVANTPLSETNTPLEECILHAASEDEVQTCLQRMDDDEFAMH